MVDDVYPGGAAAVFLGVFAQSGTQRVVAGEDGDGIPVSADTPFEAASIAKMVVATAILQLVDDGMVDLDASIAEYVAMDVAPTITVRDVMRHHSGIDNLSAQLDSCPSLATLDSMKATAEMALGPTREESYSNTNYLLLGHMVEQVSGQDVGEYTSEHIFVPTGMSSTYWWESQDGPGFYTAHRLSAPAAVSPHSCPGLDTTVGTEGLTFVTSLSDMGVFLDALFAGELVRDETLEQMLPAPDQYVGLGIWSETSDDLGMTIHGHFGSRGDLRALAFHHRETQRSVIVATFGVGEDHAEELMWRAWETTNP